MHRGFVTKKVLDARWKELENVRFQWKPSSLKIVFRKFVEAFRTQPLPPTGEELRKRERETSKEVVARVSCGHHCK